MSTVQRDMLAAGDRPWFQEAIQRRLGKQESFGTVDVAGVFDVSETTVREWIEEGRLHGADLNAGRTVPADRGRPEGERKPMRPYYRVQREAILALARRMDLGV